MKKRKIIISVLLVFFIAAAGAGYYFVHVQSASAAVSSQEIVLGEGQELLYAKISSISGNEIDYAVLEAQTVDAAEMGNGRGRNGAAQNSGDRSSNGEMPSGGGAPSEGGRLSNGEMPSGGGASSSGGRLSNSELPSGGGRSFNGEMPSDNQNGKPADSGMLSDNQNGKLADSGMPSDDQNEEGLDKKPSEDMQNRTVTTYTETGKTGQIQIPVGTDVETKLGTITTFSRLSNGDTIRMLMQKNDNGGEELLKIWIVE